MVIKRKQKKFYSALEIQKALKAKKITSDKFWKWFFGECRWGEQNLLGFDPDDDPNGGCPEYVAAIKKLKLKTDAEDDGGVWIENDL